MLATVGIQEEVEKGNVRGGASEIWRGKHSWREGRKERRLGKFLCAYGVA